MLGVWGDWSVVTTRPEMGTAELMREVADACGVETTNVAVIVPSTVPPDLFFRGVSVPSVLGVMHRALPPLC